MQRAVVLFLVSVTLFLYADEAKKEEPEVGDNRPTKATVEFTVSENGFAVIQTSSLTQGLDCRYRAHDFSPEPLAWHIRDEWKAVYLLGPQHSSDEVLKTMSAHCRKEISQRTLVGPLTKGKGNIFSKPLSCFAADYSTRGY